MQHETYPSKFNNECTNVTNATNVTNVKNVNVNLIINVFTGWKRHVWLTTSDHKSGAGFQRPSQQVFGLWIWLNRLLFSPWTQNLSIFDNRVCSTAWAWTKPLDQLCKNVTCWSDRLEEKMENWSFSYFIYFKKDQSDSKW